MKSQSVSLFSIQLVENKKEKIKQKWSIFVIRLNSHFIIYTFSSFSPKQGALK